MTEQHVVASYGHQGPAGDGADPHIADLLQRTVDGQWRITQAQASLQSVYAAAHGSLILQTELRTMSLMYAQRQALLRWMIATVFLDSVVTTYRDDASFPEDVYEFADTLCDTARHASRRAVEAATQFEW